MMVRINKQGFKDCSIKIAEYKKCLGSILS